MTVALGSWWGVIIVVAILPALIWRLLDEEKFPARNLTGYSDHEHRAHYRLVPGVW